MGPITLRLLQRALQKVRRIEKPLQNILKNTFKEIAHIRSGLKMSVAQLAAGTGAGPNY